MPHVPLDTRSKFLSALPLKLCALARIGPRISLISPAIRTVPVPWEVDALRVRSPRCPELHRRQQTAVPQRVPRLADRGVPQGAVPAITCSSPGNHMFDVSDYARAFAPSSMISAGPTNHETSSVQGVAQRPPQRCSRVVELCSLPHGTTYATSSAQHDDCLRRMTRARGEFFRQIFRVPGSFPAASFFAPVPIVAHRGRCCWLEAPARPGTR